MTLKVIEYPKCTTCRKAVKWLQDANIEFEKVHIVEQTPTVEQLTAYYKLSGLPLKKFFNTSGNKYKELGIPYPLEGMPALTQAEAAAAKKVILSAINEVRHK